MAERPAESTSRSRLLDLLPLLLVFAVTLVVFLPALHNDFVNWDDDKLLIENEAWRGLALPQLRWMFSTALLGHYQPLTWITYAIDYRLWGGLDACGFHLTSVLFHAANAVWFYLLALQLLRLTVGGEHRAAWRLVLGATLAALLFAVHPLRVESVAWVTERRDVVSAFFLLPCLLCYLRYATASESAYGWYVASVVLAVLSLLSKAWGITLPVVLLILDVYPLRRLHWGRRSLISPRAVGAYVDKVPFVLVGAWAACVAARAQAVGDVMKPLHEYGLLERIAQSFYGLAFYLWKTVWPARLAPIYEIPPDLDPFAARFVGAALAAVLVTAVLIVARRRWPAGLALWVCYCVVLLPVLGITQSGPQLVADRYSYVSCMTWSLLAGAGLAWALKRCVTVGARRPGVALVGVCVLVVVTLAGLTWRQTKVWRSSHRLWEHTLTVNPSSWNAHVNLGVVLGQRGEFDEAIEHYRAALAVKPDLGAALGNIAVVQLEQGHAAEALRYARLARRQAANDPPVLRLVGGLLFKLGRADEAAAAYRELVDLIPADPVARFDLAVALEVSGDQAGAVAQLEEVVRLIERSGSVNAGNAQTTRHGRVYIDACAKLCGLHEARGDGARARHYAEKLRAIGAD